MRVFLDTANLEEISHINKWGVIEGITTNQKIFLNEKGTNFKERVLEIINLTRGDVSVELTTKTYEEMVKEAGHYHKWSPRRIAVKVPMTADGVGLEVISTLKEKGIKVNATCMMNFPQALLAAKAGATYVSLFYRRCLDAGGDPIEEIKRTRMFIDDSTLKTEIIVGSIREVDDVANAFAAGAHICTVPYKILVKAPYHPKTEETIKEFDDSWKEFLASQQEETSVKKVKVKTK